MIRLYIENQELDVTEGFSHQITYAVDDLQNLDSKATAFSKTIVLPGTAKNNYLLGNIFEFANSNFTGEGPNVGYNFNASRSAKCRLEINGLQIIKGVLRLMEIIRDGDSIEYEVAIFGELGGFFTSLSNRKLEDLNFSMYDHTYTIGNITDRWDDKPDMIFIGNGFDTITPSYVLIRGFSDLTSIIFPGDIIKITRENDTINHGTATVTSISYNGTTDITTINVTSSTYFNASNYIFTYYVLNKGGAGVYYPLIDYGTYSTNKKDYRVKTFRPALFVREYLHKIITGAGYSYESKFFETDFFKRLIIPYNESILNTIKSDLFKGIYSGSQDYLTYAGTNTTFSFNTYIVTSLTSVFTTSDNIEFTYNGQANTIFLDSTIDIELKHYLSFFTSNTRGAGGDYSITIELYKNNTATGIKVQNSGYINVVLGDFSQRIRLSLNYTGQTSINTGDILKFVTSGTFKAKFNSGPGNNPGTFSVSHYNTPQNSIYIKSLIPVIAPIELNDKVNLSMSIPKNVLQKDFFASILKMFYLMVTEDKYKEKHLKIEPWTWFYNLNIDSYIDWSLKLDRSQPIKIKPMSEANARYYDIKFKSDNDYYNEFYRKRYNEGYGDVRYDNQLEFAKDASTTDVIFSATPLVGYKDRDKIVPTILKWNGITIGQLEERVNSNIRIMQCKNIIEVEGWDISNDSGTVIYTAVTYPYAGHFDDPDVPGSDINFGATKELFFALTSGALGNNLFNTFYSSYLAEITDKDSRLVTAKFKLNDTDIFNLDFGKFIYLEGVLYRLSRVVDYTPGEICTVELLRVIYTTYDNTVNASDDPEININGQIWKFKNLDTEFYRNGDPIPQITNPVDWENATEGAWCYYENNANNNEKYGKLYNWYAVNDARGLGPEGYHVPTNAEFGTLFTNVGNSAYAIKALGLDYWQTANGTDAYGFDARGGGERDEYGSFDYLKQRARFWTSDEYNETLAFERGIDDTSNSPQSDKTDKRHGYSVRLVKD